MLHAAAVVWLVMTRAVVSSRRISCVRLHHLLHAYMQAAVLRVDWDLEATLAEDRVGISPALSAAPHAVPHVADATPVPTGRLSDSDGSHLHPGCIGCSDDGIARHHTNRGSTWSHGDHDACETAGEAQDVHEPLLQRNQGERQFGGQGLRGTDAEEAPRIQGGLQEPLLPHDP